MKRQPVSKLTEFDVHAFTNIVKETVLDSESRVKNELKSYIDKKLEEQSGKFDKKLEEQSRSLTHLIDKKNDEQTKKLTQLMDKKNDKQTKELKKYTDEQTKDLATIILDNNTVIDKIYVNRKELSKHISNPRAHQS